MFFKFSKDELACVAEGLKTSGYESDDDPFGFDDEYEDDFR